MSVYVHLNDIFDLTKPTVIQQRLEYAFGIDGTDFWEKFFLCDYRHQDDRIVYLFTENQLKIIWDWWNNKIKTCNEDVKKNLKHSQSKIFNALRPLPDGTFVDRLRVCYAKYDAGQKPEIKRLYFGVQPNEKPNKVDFFDGRFSGKPPGKISEERRKEVLLKLVDTRQKIEEESDRIIERYESIENKKIARKWIRYLGPQYTNLPVIEYCHLIDTGCPLVIKIFPADPAA